MGRSILSTSTTSFRIHEEEIESQSFRIRPHRLVNKYILQTRRSQLGKIFSYQRSTDRKDLHLLACWERAHHKGASRCPRVPVIDRKIDWLATRKRWWSWTGSNRRPQACKARALPAELQPHVTLELLISTKCDYSRATVQENLVRGQLDSTRSVPCSPGLFRFTTIRHAKRGKFPLPASLR